MPYASIKKDKIKMSNGWHSQEDFERDIWSFSEIDVIDDKSAEEIIPPASVIEWNQRVGRDHNPSIFDNPLPAEDVTYVYSGRGRGKVTTIFRPNGYRNTTDVCAVDEDIKRRLREVSGLGYSNELIEHSFKSKTVKPKENGHKFCDVPEVMPQPSASSKSSKCSTPVSLSTTEVPKDLSSSKSSSPVSSKASSSPSPKETEETLTPPLSVLLNFGKKKCKEKETKVDPITVSSDEEHINSSNKKSFSFQCRNSNSASSTSSDEALSWRRRGTKSPNRYFTSNWQFNSLKKDSKTFDIDSSHDFPSLH